jgi:hypothetical protein
MVQIEKNQCIYCKIESDNTFRISLCGDCSYNYIDGLLEKSPRGCNICGEDNIDDRNVFAKICYNCFYDKRWN